MKINIQLVLGLVFVCVILAILFTLPAERNEKPDLEEDTVETGQDEPDEPPTEDLYEMSISTDNYTYHSRDDVQIVISITAPEDLKDATISFFGVKNRLGAYTIERNFEMDLIEGGNVIETKTNVPSCYGCSGIEPGIFQFHAVLYYNETQIINASTDIEILE